MNQIKIKKAKTPIISAILALCVILSLLLTLGAGAAASPAPAPTPADVDAMRARYAWLFAQYDASQAGDANVAATLNSILNSAATDYGRIDPTDNATRTRVFTNQSLGTNVNDKSDATSYMAAYRRLSALAIAYASPESSLYGDAALSAEIIRALDFLYDRRYGPVLAYRQGNGNPVYNYDDWGTNPWWEYEIGIPLALNNVLVLVYDDLTPAQLAKYLAIEELIAGNPNFRLQNRDKERETGANLVWKCLAVLQMGILKQDMAMISLAMDSLNSSVDPKDHPSMGGAGLLANGVTYDHGVLKYHPYDIDPYTNDRYETYGEFNYMRAGMYEDGTFLFHGTTPYTGGYGVSMLWSMADILYITNGSPWDIENLEFGENAYKWVENAYEPFIYKGGIMDMVKGSIGTGADGHENGRKAVIAMARIAEVAPPEYSQHIKELVKYMVNADTSITNYYTTGDLASVAATDFMLPSSVAFVKKILNDPSIDERGPAEMAKQFPAMDKTVYATENFALGISMNSTRSPHTYADIRNPGNFNFINHGMTYLYNDDLTQFNSNYWSSINRRRLPGTTVDQDSNVNGGTGNDWYIHGGRYDWAGGAVWGKYTTSGMRLTSLAAGEAWNNTIRNDNTIKKSWMMLGDKIVALGAELTGPAVGSTFETIIENRKITNKADAQIIVDGTAESSANFAAKTINGAEWAWMEGVVAGADVGYYFPVPTDVMLLRETRSTTQRWFTMWIDHGKNPTTGSGAAYAYVLLPGMDAAGTEAFADDPDIIILKNDADAQAVEDTALNITMANFWQNTPVTAGSITSDKESSVIIHEDAAGAMDIAVADPTQKNTTVTIEIDRPGYSVISADSRVSVTQLKPTIILEVDVAGAFGASFEASIQVEEDEFDLLRQRYIEMLAGKGNYDITQQYIANRVNAITSDAASMLGSLNATPNTSNRNYLFSWIPLGGSQPAKGSNINESINDLRDMAIAYKTAESSLYMDTNLRDSIIKALDWIIDNHYNKDLASSQLGSGYNWWFYEIGTPLGLNDLVALMYDDLTSAQITKYMDAVHRFVGDNPRRRVLQSASETGANLVWKCTIFTEMGVISKNAAPLLAGRDALSDELAYNAANTTGDGYYTDGSFLMHGTYAYTGGYGSSLLSNMVDLLCITNNSSFEVIDPNINNVYEWIFDSYEPLLYRGAIMDMVRGREIARAYPFDQIIGHDTIVSVAKLTENAPIQYQQRFKELIKHTVNTSNMRNFYSYLPLSLITFIQDIRDDDSIADRGYIEIAKQFPTMARTSYLTEKFAVGISMSSSRISRYEYMNNENKKGWHTGDGMLFLYNSDLRQFNNTNFNDGQGDVGAFWSTVDMKRLPGTTVDSVPLAVGSNAGRTSGWAGGAEWDKYAVTGMLVRGLGYTDMSVKKSWMMLGDKVVALGADLSGTASGDAFETIVENRKISFTPNTPFIVNGNAMPTANFAETDVQGAKWAWLGYTWIPDDSWKPNGLWSPPAGSWGPPSEPEENTYIGYYFPEPADIKVKREARTGSWLDIGAEATEPVQRNDTYLTMWVDHGKEPATGAGEAYSYVLLPGKSAGEVEAYANDPDIAVLRNDEFVQSVSDSTLNIMMANFWQNGKASVGSVTLDKPASVIFHAGEGLTSAGGGKSGAGGLGGVYDISIADFTMTGSANVITMELDRECLSVIAGDPRVNVVQYAPVAIVEVDMTGTYGRSVEFSLDMGALQYEADTAYVSITGPSAVVSGAGATVEYIITAIRMPQVSGIELEFEVDGAYLSSNSFTGLNGFSIIGAGSYGTPIQWTSNGDIWTGKATLLSMPGGIGGAGGDISGDADLLKLVFNVKEGMLGASDVKLNYVKFSAAGATVAAVIENGTVTTTFEQYYSPYDLNKDGVIDLNDLTFAIQFLTSQEGDANWDEAKVVDFHEDGVIDILDLIEILANYTVPYYS